MSESDKTMRSWKLQGDAERTMVELQDASVPVPGPDQLLLRVRAASLNRGEFIAGHGLHKPGAAKPAGMEAAGEVTAVGEGVTKYKVGDHVFGRCGGAFSAYSLMDAREAMPVPQHLSMEEASAVTITFMTVHDMLMAQGGLTAGEWLLVTGISSGVGVAALQTGRALGAKVIGTSGSAEKLAKLTALGLDVALQTRKPDFVDAVMKATDNRGVNLIVNNVGGSVFAECVKSLAFEGRLATVGYVDGVLEARMDIEAMHARRLKLFGVSNKLRSPAQKLEAARRFATELLPVIVERKIKPVVDRVFAFEELVAAKALMESNTHLGKIVLRGAA
jgi:NADPH:quinone reductase-like Zn-dependent oxidoreductase